MSPLLSSIFYLVLIVTFVQADDNNNDATNNVKPKAALFYYGNLHGCETNPLLPNGAILAPGSSQYGARREIICPVGTMLQGSHTYAVCGQELQWIIGAECVLQPEAERTTPDVLITQRPSYVTYYRPRDEDDFYVTRRPYYTAAVRTTGAMIADTAPPPAAAVKSGGLLPNEGRNVADTSTTRLGQDSIIALAVILVIVILAIIGVLLLYLGPLWCWLYFPNE